MTTITLRETQALAGSETLEFRDLSEFLDFLQKEWHLTDFGLVDEVEIVDPPSPVDDLDQEDVEEL